MGRPILIPLEYSISNATITYIVILQLILGIQVRRHTTSIGIQCDLSEEVSVVRKASNHESCPRIPSHLSDSTDSTDSDRGVRDDDPDYKPTKSNWRGERLDNMEDGVFVSQS